ncbi:MAG TPA: tyrosine-type recombinase/integrase [Candidatus Limnocylindrales bacterium]
MGTRLNLSPAQERARILARSRQYLTDSGLSPASPAFQLAWAWLDGIDNLGTMRRYSTCLARYFPWCVAQRLDPFDLTRIEANQFAAYLKTLSPQNRPGMRKQSLLADNTVKMTLAVARAFHREAFEAGLVGRHAFSHIRVSAEVETATPALTPQDINLVLNGIAGGEVIRLGDQRDYALIYLASRVGPRRKEVAALRWLDTFPTARGVQIRFHRKGGGIDKIDVPSDVWMVLEQWRAVLERRLGRKIRPEEPVFPSIAPEDIRNARRGGLAPVRPPLVSKVCRSRFTDAGLTGERMAAHVLRATAATIAFESGATVDQVRIMLGHKNESTTWTYLKRLNRPSPACLWALAALPFPDAVMPLASERIVSASAPVQLSLFDETGWDRHQATPGGRLVRPTSEIPHISALLPAPETVTTARGALTLQSAVA